MTIEKGRDKEREREKERNRKAQSRPSHESGSGVDKCDIQTSQRYSLYSSVTMAICALSP
jgi:hypothetical protein